MSKQSTNKEIQKYEPKPIFPMCSNCRWFESDKEERQFGVYEANLRCGLPDGGGFAIKKQGNCKNHEYKPLNQDK